MHLLTSRDLQTFNELLRCFAGLSNAEMEDLKQALDTPENTLTLETAWQYEFYQFKWCLIPVNMVSLLLFTL